MKKNFLNLLFIRHPMLLIIMLAGALLYYKFCWALISGWLFIHILTPVLELVTQGKHNLIYWLTAWVLTAALIQFLFFAIYFLMWGIAIFMILTIGKKFKMKST